MSDKPKSKGKRKRETFYPMPSMMQGTPRKHSTGSYADAPAEGRVGV